MSLVPNAVRTTAPYRLIEAVAPSAEPILLADAKTYLKLGSDTTDDAIVTRLIAAARRHGEKVTRRAFITQSWQMFMDNWPADPDSDLWWEGTRVGAESTVFGGSKGISLPKPPLISVTHIKTYDDSDAATTFSSGSYYVDTATEPGRVVLRTGSTWPVPTRTANGIEIQFQAGYGAAGTNVPADLLEALYEMVEYMYDNRGCAPQEAALNGSAASILSTYRILTL